MAKQKHQAEFVRWFGPLLTALRDLGGSASPREAIDRIAELEKVPDELRNTLLKSGQGRFCNQVHWARQYLVWEGLIDSGRRGVWSLTPAGRDRTLSAEEAREIFLRQVQRQDRIRKSAGAGDDKAASEQGIPSDTPQADQDSSLQRFLDVVKVIGAMDGRAEKGIFLTTSTFSTKARAEAERPGAVPIELVDGERLFEMFKKYELGLKPRVVFDIDLPFFDQFD